MGYFFYLLGWLHYALGSFFFFYFCWCKRLFFFSFLGVGKWFECSLDDCTSHNVSGKWLVLSRKFSIRKRRNFSSSGKCLKPSGLPDQFKDWSSNHIFGFILTPSNIYAEKAVYATVSVNRFTAVLKKTFRSQLCQDIFLTFFASGSWNGFFVLVGYRGYIVARENLIRIATASK